ncbi:hypothetical protein FH972_022228 [Carpinus fangiana]|uniref:VPS37 C-terminal domain-containing protein n=1 Tax=Carpinus fangiana TaxID=176857 RepID=A0A5N6KRN0_9ROSI|nr:hypothetical protein FH972_022228 [Carpinus fangiana]
MSSPHPGSPYIPSPLPQSYSPHSSAAPTPPPPPPKPNAGSHSHTPSLTGPPLPPHPHQQTIQPDQERRYSQPPPPPSASHPSQGPQYAPYEQQQQQQQQSPQLPSQTQQQPSQPQYPLPPEHWLPADVHTKSKQDLQTLLSTPALLSALLHAPSTIHPSLAASNAALKHLIAANTTLASELVSLESNLTTRRDHTQQHLLAVRALEQQWRKKQTELEARLEAFGPRVLHQRLGQGITEQDAVCRGLEESFLEGEGVATEREVGEWVRRVREGRKVAGLRRERRRRWDEGRVGGWR